MDKDNRVFNIPKTLLFLGTLIRNPYWPMQRWRCRVIKFSNSPILFDLRQFDVYPDRAGYNSKGSSLNVHQAKHLRAILNRAIPIMERLEKEMNNENETKESSTTTQEVTQEDQAS